MGEGSLTGAVGIDRGMQLLHRPRLGCRVGPIAFLELFLLHFLISCQHLPLDEFNKKAEGMEGWFTDEGQGGERIWRNNGE